MFTRVELDSICIGFYLQKKKKPIFNIDKLLKLINKIFIFNIDHNSFGINYECVTQRQRRIRRTCNVLVTSAAKLSELLYNSKRAYTMPMNIL